MAKDSMQRNKNNEIHIKTQYYEHQINGTTPQSENDLVHQKKRKKLITLIESTLEMRKGVATAAFVEDVVQLQFVIENLEV